LTASFLLRLMEHLTADYQAPNWGATEATRCTLYLFIDAAGTSVLAADSDHLIQRLSVQSYPKTGRFTPDTAADLRQVWSEESTLKYTFSQVTGVFNNGYATLVPRRMFDPAQLATYLKLLLRPEIGPLEYQYEPIPDMDCLLVYALPTDVLKTFAWRFPQGRVTHLAAPLLKYWHRLAPAQHFGAFANIRWNTLQIAVFDHRNLLFYNTFSMSHPDDLLYYTLLVYEQFRLDPYELPLCISGDITATTEEYRALRRCFKHLRFASLPETVHIPSVLQDVPKHQFLDLFCHTEQV